MIFGSTAVTTVRSTAPMKIATHTRARMTFGFWILDFRSRVVCINLKSTRRPWWCTHVHRLLVIAEHNLPGGWVGGVGAAIHQPQLGHALGRCVGPEIGLDIAGTEQAAADVTQRLARQRAT